MPTRNLQDLAENFPNLALDRVRPSRALLETVQVREELAVHELEEIVARPGLVVVELDVLVLGRGPGLPLILRLKDEGVPLPLELRFRQKSALHSEGTLLLLRRFGLNSTMVRRGRASANLDRRAELPDSELLVPC